MARSLNGRLWWVGGRIATGALLLAAAALLLQWILAALIRIEERAAAFWFAIYKGAGRVSAGGLAVVAILAVLHLWRHGRDDIRPRSPEDRLRWWSAVERSLHWTMVLTFLVLLVTGLELYYAGFGLPSPLTRTMRAWHVGEPFMALGAGLFLLWHRDALPRRYDAAWLAQLGGHLHRGPPPPAGRFNAGQKLWFWLEAAAGLVMAVTGQWLVSTSRFDAGYLTLLAIHLAAAALFLLVLAVHFYLAVVGVRGALGGMIHGVIGRQGAARLHSEAEPVKASSPQS